MTGQDNIKISELNKSELRIHLENLVEEDKLIEFMDKASSNERSIIFDTAFSNNFKSVKYELGCLATQDERLQLLTLAPVNYRYLRTKLAKGTFSRPNLSRSERLFLFSLNGSTISDFLKDVNKAETIVAIKNIKILREITDEFELYNLILEDLIKEAEALPDDSSELKDFWQKFEDFHNRLVKGKFDIDHVESLKEYCIYFSLSHFNIRNYLFDDYVDIDAYRNKLQLNYSGSAHIEDEMSGSQVAENKTTISFAPHLPNIFPFHLSSISNMKTKVLTSNINVIVGVNGIGKSTLLEALASKLNLKTLCSKYQSPEYDEPNKLLEHLSFSSSFARTGFFFRSVDWQPYLESYFKFKEDIEYDYKDLGVNANALDEMVRSALMKRFGDFLIMPNECSHGEALMQVMKLNVKYDGIYILDEPESALSPIKQIEFIDFLLTFTKQRNAQVILSTHSPILMSMPNADIFEITETSFEQVRRGDLNILNIINDYLSAPDSFFDEYGN